MVMRYDGCNVMQQLFAHLFGTIFSTFQRHNRPTYVRYRYLRMVDGYGQMDWPMQYTQSVAIAWGGRETEFQVFCICLGTGDKGLSLCPNEKYGKGPKVLQPAITGLILHRFELVELELVQSHSAQKPMLRGEVGARVRVIRACGQRRERRFGRARWCKSPG